MAAEEFGCGKENGQYVSYIATFSGRELVREMGSAEKLGEEG